MFTQRSAVTAVLILWALVGGGCGRGSEEQVYQVKGVVVAPAADGEILIMHEEIPGFMPAMTMPFFVDQAREPLVGELQVGDEVTFTFRVGENSRATQFQRTGSPRRDRSTKKPAAGITSRRVREGESVPAFQLVDQTGTAFDQERLRGQFTVLTFIFTRCPVPEFCPRVSGQFQELQQALTERLALPDTQLLSVTIDPEYDTPEVLRAYAERFGAEASRWTFATGTPEQVDALRAAFAVFAERSGGTLDHTLATALIGPDLTLHHVWRGTEWTPTDVITALEQQAAQ